MNTAELEYRLIYSMVVAGKSAAFTEQALKRFFSDEDLSPFTLIRSYITLGCLETKLCGARTGNYGKLAKGFRELVADSIDLALCTPARLEEIHGIGPKTSRFFILWTRPDARHAALDTHVLKWLRFAGYEAPVSTPSGDKYEKLEIAFLKEAQARGMTARHLDAQIWDWCSKGLHREGTWPASLQPFAISPSSSVRPAAEEGRRG